MTNYVIGNLSKKSEVRLYNCQFHCRRCFNGHTLVTRQSSLSGCDAYACVIKARVGCGYKESCITKILEYKLKI